MPPRVPTGRPGTWSCCERSPRTRNVSSEGVIAGTGHDLRGNLPCGRRYRSISDVETLRTLALLSKPNASSSGGRSDTHIDLERKQISNCVSVFRAIEPVHRRCAEHRCRQRCLVEGRLEMRHEAVERSLIGTRNADGRHHAGANFADYLLPHLSAGRDVGERHAVESQARGLQPLVMAGDAGPASTGPSGQEQV